VFQIHQLAAPSPISSASVNPQNLAGEDGAAEAGRAAPTVVVDRGWRPARTGTAPRPEPTSSRSIRSSTPSVRSWDAP
jgi:hypothetical protein